MAINWYILVNYPVNRGRAGTDQPKPPTGVRRETKVKGLQVVASELKVLYNYVQRRLCDASSLKSSNASFKCIFLPVT